MARSIGMVVSRHATLGVVEGDHVAGAVVRYPAGDDSAEGLHGIPTDQLVGALANELKATWLKVSRWMRSDWRSRGSSGTGGSKSLQICNNSRDSRWKRRCGWPSPSVGSKPK